MGLVENNEDCETVGMDPIEKVKGNCITKMKVDWEVVIACPIVTYALKVDVDPGEFALKSFKILTPIKFVKGKLLITAPKLGLAS